jgi:hypothetical protein
MHADSAGGRPRFGHNLARKAALVQGWSSPCIGHGTIGSDNHRARFPLFPVEAIKRIAADPGIVESWREDDRRAAVEVEAQALPATSSTIE